MNCLSTASEANTQKPSAAPTWTSSGEALADLAYAQGLAAQPTPFLVIDLDAMERNIARMAKFFEERRASLWPHVKHHKSTEIARAQIAAGASGVTCSTTDEVAAVLRAGIPHALLANVVTDPARLASLTCSATRGMVTALVDSTESADLLSAAIKSAGARIRVLIEFDIGMARCGVQDVEHGVRLAQRVARLPGLDFSGIQAYEGHLVEIEDRAERRRAVTAAFEPVGRLIHALVAEGLGADVVTGGSTSTYDVTGDLPIVTHVQAGTYVLMDATYERLTPEFEPALALVASVLTARPTGDVIVDVGSKRLATDWGRARLTGFEALSPNALSEEHAKFVVSGSRRPQVGERVALVPGHACTTMSMYCRVFGCRRGRLERVVEIDARDPLA